MTSASRSTHLSWGNPVRIGNVDVIPVERTVVRGLCYGESWWANASKEAYALLIRDEDGWRGYDMEGNEVSAEALRQQVDPTDPETFQNE